MMEESADSLAVVCPGHNGPDQIKQASDVFAEGTPERLSPVPVLKSANRIAWTGTIIGVAGAVLVWAGAAVHGGVPGPVLAAACVCFAYAIACYGWAAARRKSVVRIERGMPKALAVWRAGWYCARCDGVFFPASAVPADAVPAGAVAGRLMTAMDFQHLVWTVGGYGRKLSQVS